MRRLNLVFLAVLVIVATVLGGGIHLVHGFQMRRNASALLDRARRAESADELAKAEESLGWYLNLLPDDGSAWVWYASVVDRRNTDRRRLERNFLVQEEALRHKPGDAKLLRRCADLALELKRYHDAHRHLNSLLETGQATRCRTGRVGRPAGPVRERDDPIMSRRNDRFVQGARTRSRAGLLLRSAGAAAPDRPAPE